MQAKKYADAAKAYGDAVKLFPADPTALKGQRDAQQALDTAAGEQKRFTDYQRFIKEAQAAMQAKRYVDAQRAYGEALKLFPADPTAQRGMQDAQRAAADASKTKAPPASPPPPPQPDPQARFQKEMDNAAALEKQQKFADAMKAYQEALKIRPGDAKASQGVKLAEFNWRLAEGQKHLQARRFVEAQREFEAALRLFPGNPTATQLLKKAQAK
jgi:tetratricopeptide (TPR) repeat protein